MDFWEEDPEAEPHSHHITSRIQTFKMPYYSWCWPWSSGRGSVCWVSLRLLFLPFHAVLFERKLPCTHPTLREWELCSISLGANYLYQLFEIPPCRRFTYSPFICSYYQHEIIHIYFIFGLFIIQYYFILLLKLFQLWPLRALSHGCCVPLTHFHHHVLLFVFLSTFLLSRTI